jgi:hypothetical protein
VNSLNIVRVIISPGADQATRFDVVLHSIAVIGESLPAERAFAVLNGNFLVHQLPNLCVGSEFPVPARMMRVLDPANILLP